MWSYYNVAPTELVKALKAIAAGCIWSRSCVWRGAGEQCHFPAFIKKGGEIFLAGAVLGLNSALGRWFITWATLQNGTFCLCAICLCHLIDHQIWQSNSSPLWAKSPWPCISQSVSVGIHHQRTWVQHFLLWLREGQDCRPCGYVVCTLSLSVLWLLAGWVSTFCQTEKARLCMHNSHARSGSLLFFFWCHPLKTNSSTWIRVWGVIAPGWGQFYHLHNRGWGRTIYFGQIPSVTN
jgi:hypothetical protein